MKHRILVSYASGSGSTAEVAAFIGETLSGEETVVDVQEASEVVTLNAYSAVVVGSSIRFGRWLPAAIDFLEQFANELKAMPIALFMTCLTVIDDSEENWETALAYWDPVLQRVPEADPVGLGLFAGSIAPEFEQLAEYQGSAYGDYRDWDSIRTWTQEIRPMLIKGTPRTQRPMVLSGTILSYTDLSGADLSLFAFQNTDLVRARLKEARLHRADLQHARMEGADLQGADFSQANLGWADLPEALCQETNFSRASMIGANLEKANLQGASLPNSILNGAILAGARIQDADLARAEMNWANLSGSDLTRADLRQASLGWADLRGAQLTDANLQGARYNVHTKWPSGFSPDQAGCVLVNFLPH